MSRSPPPDAEDRRFQALLAFFAACALVMVVWAAGVQPVETLSVAVPERLLEVVRLERPPLPSPEAGGPPRSRSPGPTVDAPWGAAPTIHPGPEADDARVVRHLMRVFSHPVFGAGDVGDDALARALDGADFEDVAPEADPGLLASAAGDGRVDVGLPGGISRMDRPEVLLPEVFDTRPASRFATARAAPRFEPPPEVSDAAIAVALRGWKRHAASCRDRVAPHFRGRVVVRLTLASGVVDAVELESADRPPEVLRKCLETRARRLLQFPSGEHGLAELPLVYE